MSEFTVSGYSSDREWRYIMRSRPHGGKPTLALWMLVAVADLAILAAAAGPGLTLTILAIVATVIVAGRGLWLLQHRSAPRADAARRRA